MHISPYFRCICSILITEDILGLLLSGFGGTKHTLMMNSPPSLTNNSTNFDGSHAKTAKLLQKKQKTVKFDLCEE